MWRGGAPGRLSRLNDLDVDHGNMGKQWMGWQIEQLGDFHAAILREVIPAKKGRKSLPLYGDVGCRSNLATSTWRGRRD